MAEGCLGTGGFGDFCHPHFNGSSKQSYCWRDASCCVWSGAIIAEKFVDVLFPHNGCNVFSSVRMNRSISPFASGQRGVTFRCVNPRYSANSLHSALLNGGPLSERTILGIPKVENILSSWGFADVEVSSSITGYRE